VKKIIKYIDKGDLDLIQSSEYSSNNSEQLDIEALKKKLLNLKIIQAALKGERLDREGLIKKNQIHILI